MRRAPSSAWDIDCASSEPIREVLESDESDVDEPMNGSSKKVDACRVAVRSRQTSDQTKLDRVFTDAENDRESARDQEVPRQLLSLDCACQDACLWDCRTDPAETDGQDRAFAAFARASKGTARSKKARTRRSSSARPSRLIRSD